MPDIRGNQIKGEKMSDLINNLKQKRGELADKMEDMVKNIDSDNWNDDNNVDFNKISNEFDDLGSRIEKLERAESAKNSVNSFEPNQRQNIGTQADNKTRFGTQDYENDFKNYVMSKGKINNALEAGVDSEGGYIVAESWENELNRLLFDTNVMRQVATVRTYTNDRNIPLTASVGAAAWVDEEGTYPTNSAAFANKKLLAYKLGNIELVSEELLQDSFINIRAELAMMYAQSFAATEESAFTTGNDSGKPNGVITAATSAFTAAATGALTYDEVIDLLASVNEKYARNGIFMSNRSTAAVLRKLKDSNGQPLWQPAMTAGMPDTLFGKAYRMNEAMADLAASSKSLAFGDFSYYRIADRAGLMMQILTERYAETGQVGFKFMKRTDGDLLRTDAVKVITQAAS